MNYRETLEACEANQISIFDATVANEVDFFFPEGGRNRPDFEQLCELAGEAYLKVDCTTSISQVVGSLRELLEAGNDINSITRHDIIENIEY